MLNMLHLRSVEVFEQLPCFGRIVAQARQVRDDQLLSRDVLLALGNMPLGLFKMLQMRGAIHDCTLA